MNLQRYGSNAAVLLLGALALLFLLLSSWVLFAVFVVLAAGAIFVRSVRRSTGR